MGRHQRMDGDFRLLLLRLDHRRAAGDGAMNRTAIKDHAIDVTLMQAAIELLFRFPFGEKFRMPYLNAVAEFARQAVEERPEGGEVPRAERRRQLEPVLADARRQRRQTGKNSWLKSSQLRSAARCEMVAGNLKQKRKSSWVCSYQRLTISAFGNAYRVVLPSTQLKWRAYSSRLVIPSRTHFGCAHWGSPI